MKKLDLIFCGTVALFASLLTLNVRYFSQPVELSLVIIKPDGTALGLREHIYGRFESELGLHRVIELENVTATPAQLREHYAEHVARDFYPSLVDFMRSGPISISIWRGGRGTVSLVRGIVGTTDPKSAGNNTIRGQFGVSSQRNVIHASDSESSATREIQIWFGHQ